MTVPPPAIFYACPAQDGASGAKFAGGNPFDRAHLGFDDLFAGGTVFHHFRPKGASATNAGRYGDGVAVNITVPVLDTTHPFFPYLEGMTGLVVFAGFVWLLWGIVGPALPGRGRVEGRKGDGKGDGNVDRGRGKKDK